MPSHQGEEPRGVAMAFLAGMMNAILDSSLYIPALSPIYEPQKLAQNFSGDRTIWMTHFLQTPLANSIPMHL